MANFNIRVDLLKTGGVIRNIKGKNGVKACIVIPVDSCDGLFVGEKGAYLNLTAYEMKEQRYGDTHCVKPSLTKEQRDSRSEEERKNLPILGGMHPIEYRQADSPLLQSAGAAVEVEDDGDDLPF